MVLFDETRRLIACFQYSMNREEKLSLGFVYHADEESRLSTQMKDFCLHFQKMSV